MKKCLTSIMVSALVISSSLQAHVIAPDEIKQFAAEAMKIDFDKAPDDVKMKISAEYTQRVKLAEVLTTKLKNDPEFIKLSEILALDLWSKRIVSNINPSDEELKVIFNDAKDLNVPPSYKLRYIVVTHESLSDDLIKQLTAKTGDERIQLFTSLAAAHSQDINTKDKGGFFGWVNAEELPSMIFNVIKDKEAGSVVKIAGDNNMWDVVMVDDIKEGHPATFEEAKNYLTNRMRQQAIENEAKKILEVKTPPETAAKRH